MLRGISFSPFLDDGLNSDLWSSAICDSTYFESVLCDKVPTMTSDTTPYGEAFASSVYHQYLAYKAFDKVIDDGITNILHLWHSASSDTAYVGYKFNNPTVIKKVEISPFYNPEYGLYAKDYVIQGSNDNFIDDIHNLHNGSFENKDVGTVTITISNICPFLYYRLYSSSTYMRSNDNKPYHAIDELQFYGRYQK